MYSSVINFLIFIILVDLAGSKQLQVELKHKERSQITLKNEGEHMSNIRGEKRDNIDDMLAMQDTNDAQYADEPSDNIPENGDINKDPEIAGDVPDSKNYIAESMESRGDIPLNMDDVVKIIENAVESTDVGEDIYDDYDEEASDNTAQAEHNAKIGNENVDPEPEEIGSDIELVDPREGEERFHLDAEGIQSDMDGMTHKKREESVVPLPEENENDIDEWIPQKKREETIVPEPEEVASDIEEIKENIFPEPYMLASRNEVRIPHGQNKVSILRDYPEIADYTDVGEEQGNKRHSIPFTKCKMKNSLSNKTISNHQQDGNQTNINYNITESSNSGQNNITNKIHCKYV